MFAASAGQKVTHYILEHGRFASATAKLKATGFAIRWQSRGQDNAERQKKAASKTKYTCPACGLNAWGKPDIALICGECYDDGEGGVSVMVTEAT